MDKIAPCPTSPGIVAKCKTLSTIFNKPPSKKIITSSGFRFFNSLISLIFSTIKSQSANLKNNFFIESSCEEGYCGTCLTRYLGGEPDHRDTVLNEKDRKDFVLICCSRSNSPELVLDL